MVRLLSKPLRMAFEYQGCVLYRHQPRQGPGKADPEVKTYTEWSEVPLASRATAAVLECRSTPREHPE